MRNSSTIRKAGNDGRPYYLNEDASENSRTKKADILKYIKYLKENLHTVTRAGDNLIIDGTEYMPSQFNDLPEGQRIQDSRTIAKRGVVAFNSVHSPLSNLYPCKLKFEGNSYNSVEQAYQYLKAKHHKRHQRAFDLLRQNNQYDMVAMTKRDLDNPEWINCREALMERLLREKADQVHNFRVTLKKTDRHHLVGNSFNSLWGSGCPFLHDAVWEGSFKGRNLMGKILERV